MTENGAQIDNDLIERYREGDTRSFERLYGKYKDRIFFYVLSLVKNRHIAEEIVQDVFTSFILNLHRYEHRGSFQNYLYVSARNRSIDYLRKDNPLDMEADGVQSDSVLFTTDDSPSDRLIAQEELECLNRSIYTLPDEQRETLILRIYDGLSFAEIAAITQTSINTAISRYNYALQKLRKMMLRESENG